MGADLYIEVIYDENHKRYQPKFDKAVEERNSIVIPDVVQSAIYKRICENLGQDVSPGFDEAHNLPIPENLKLEPEFETWRERYNRHVEAQKKVSRYYNLQYARGYFRDSYNMTSLFWRLGLSWWQDLEKFAKDGKLRPAGAKRLLSLVKKTPLKPVTKEELEQGHATVDDGENTVAAWNRMFVGKKRRFIKFLELAIKANKAIICSC